MGREEQRDGLTANESCLGLGRLWIIRTIILLDKNKETFAVQGNFSCTELCALIAASVNTTLRFDEPVAFTPSQTSSPGSQTQCELYHTAAVCRRKCHYKAEGGRRLPEHCQ